MEKTEFNVSSALSLSSAPCSSLAPSRRHFLRGSLALGVTPLLPQALAEVVPGARPAVLEEFRYEEVQVTDPVAVAQRANVTEVLLGLNEDSLLKPFREMAGVAAPGQSLGGWYEYNPRYNFHHDDIGLAPGASFGQWVSALARLSAASRFGQTGPGTTPDMGAGPQLAAKALRLNQLLAANITPAYFKLTRFPGYSFDKLVCGLMDAFECAGDRSAWSTLDKVAAAAVPALPGRAVDREVQWAPGKDLSWMWDETYTLSENLYIVSSRGADPAYRRMARAYLDDDTYFLPLAQGGNALADKHAYSYVNALCSAMQAYLVDGSAIHLQAAKNGFDMLEEQSFATGGWGPDEVLRKPGYDEVAKSLTASHNSFETPCGSYAHMKLTRYLLRATRDGRYGDSMERVMCNTVRGVLPLQADGHSFYYADYNWVGKRVYSLHRWPCCSGTLPQVVADYGINTYLREPGGIWVNLYQASQLHWQTASGAVALEQSGSYLDDGKVRLRITASRPAVFALHLRVPAWAETSYTLRVNGKAASAPVQSGFVRLERKWRTGDLVEAEFAPTLRLEALPPNGGPGHPGTVALLRGPLVLFALREAGESGLELKLEREALLTAERTGPSEWTAKSQSGTRRFVPFTAVGESLYSTYVTAV